MSSSAFQVDRSWVVRGILLAAASMSTSGSVLAWDSATLCAWHRTWHGPNGLATPLRGYYIPRSPAWCDSGIDSGRWGYALNPGCAGCTGAPAAYGGSGSGFAYSPQVGIGFEPVQFERLGQIPNDLGVGGVAPAGTLEAGPPRR